jgi:type I restriction enzyme M protein
MIASMGPRDGRVGVVMPHGVLFRAGAEGAIRECLVRGDLLEAVVGLPANLFYSTPIPACLLIFRATKSVDRRGQVLFVDGSKRFVKGRNQNTMRDEDVEHILRAYRTGADVLSEGAEVRFVLRTELDANEWDLNISRYIKGAATPAVDVETALVTLRATQEALRLAELSLEERLAEAGYE